MASIGVGALGRLVIGAVLVGFGVNGCASDYVWLQAGAPSATHEWVVVHDRRALHDICAISQDRAPSLGACAFQIRQTGKCWVYSVWSADEAKRQYAGDGDDLYSHEMRHCQGYRHP